MSHAMPRRLRAVVPLGFMALSVVAFSKTKTGADLNIIQWVTTNFIPKRLSRRSRRRSLTSMPRSRRVRDSK